MSKFDHAIAVLNAFVNVEGEILITDVLLGDMQFIGVRARHDFVIWSRSEGRTLEEGLMALNTYGGMLVLKVRGPRKDGHPLVWIDTYVCSVKISELGVTASFMPIALRPFRFGSRTSAEHLRSVLERKVCSSCFERYNGTTHTEWCDPCAIVITREAFADHGVCLQCERVHTSPDFACESIAPNSEEVQEARDEAAAHTKRNKPAEDYRKACGECKRTRAGYILKDGVCSKCARFLRFVATAAPILEGGGNYSDAAKAMGISRQRIQQILDQDERLFRYRHAERKQTTVGAWIVEAEKVCAGSKTIVQAERELLEQGMPTSVLNAMRPLIRDLTSGWRTEEDDKVRAHAEEIFYFARSNGLSMRQAWLQLGGDPAYDGPPRVYWGVLGDLIAKDKTLADLQEKVNKSCRGSKKVSIFKLAWVFERAIQRIDEGKPLYGAFEGLGVTPVWYADLLKAIYPEAHAKGRKNGHLIITEKNRARGIASRKPKQEESQASNE